MKEILDSRGFIYVDSCSCNPKFDYYAHTSQPHLKIGIAASVWRLQQRSAMHWNTLQYGNQSNFEQYLNQYFPQ